MRRPHDFARNERRRKKARRLIREVVRKRMDKGDEPRRTRRECRLRKALRNAGADHETIYWAAYALRQRLKG
jgi:hypothetical protein